MYVQRAAAALGAEERVQHVVDEADLARAQRHGGLLRLAAAVRRVAHGHVHARVVGVVERHVGHPEAAECPRRPGGAGKHETLRERGVHDAPLLRDVAAAAPARGDAALRRRIEDPGVEDERLTALERVRIDVHERLRRRLREEQLVVRARRRIAGVPHRQRRVLEERLVERLARPIHLQKHALPRVAGEDGFDLAALLSSHCFTSPEAGEWNKSDVAFARPIIHAPL